MTVEAARGTTRCLAAALLFAIGACRTPPFDAAGAGTLGRGCLDGRRCVEGACRDARLNSGGGPTVTLCTEDCSWRAGDVPCPEPLVCASTSMAGPGVCMVPCVTGAPCASGKGCMVEVFPNVCAP